MPGRIIEIQGVAVGVSSDDGYAAAVCDQTVNVSIITRAGSAFAPVILGHPAYVGSVSLLGPDHVSLGDAHDISKNSAVIFPSLRSVFL